MATTTSPDQSPQNAAWSWTCGGRFGRLIQNGVVLAYVSQTDGGDWEYAALYVPRPAGVGTRPTRNEAVEVAEEMLFNHNLLGDETMTMSTTTIHQDFLDKYEEVGRANDAARKTLRDKGIDVNRLKDQTGGGDKDVEHFWATVEAHNKMFRDPRYIPAMAWKILASCAPTIAKYPGKSTITGAEIKPGDSIRLKNVNLTALTREQIGGGLYILALNSEF